MKKSKKKKKKKNGSWNFWKIKLFTVDKFKDADFQYDNSFLIF